MNRHCALHLIVAALIAIACRTAFAGFGDGITAGRLTLHPYVEASVNYDSNAQQVPQDPVSQEDAAAVADGAAPTDPDAERRLKEESDIYYEARGGTSLLWFNETSAISGSAWAFLRRYTEQDIEDEEGFGERLGVLGGDREQISWQVFQSFERRSDFEMRRAEDVLEAPGLTLTAPLPAGEEVDLEDELLRTRSERDLFSVGVDVGHDVTEKLEVDAGYSYGETQYKDEALFGQSQQTGTGSLGLRLTHKTTGFLNGSYGEEDNDNYVRAVPFYTVLLGLRSGTSPKLSYNIGVGYQNYETAEIRPRELEDGTLVFRDRTQILPDGTVVPPQPRINPVTGEVVEDPPPPDENQDGLAYNAGITWQPTPKLGVSLTGRNSYQSTSSGSQREVNLVQLSASHRPTTSITLSARLGYRDEKALDEILLIDDDGVESRIKENREYLTAGGRIQYRPTGKWYEFYVDTTYEDISSNLEYQSYDRIRFGAGLRATY